ncbi:complement C1r subcomponent-like protein isoform X5 [Callithrix jacchus]|uniref:complement C1r subcomponent-like protein isoform X5 n=1 Tax=Callithrix jacchus TaxID=9483 RepID=UPI0023DD130F|nr:complement C1r subcomponent-like protein isoform X5 [Callithrix jacchus]
MPGPRVLGNCRWRSPHSTGCPGAMWWLLLWGVLQACPTRGSVLLAQQLPQQLTSPGYPEPYHKGQESTADIQAPEGFAVRLVFQDFDLEPSQDCAGDSVTISASGLDPSQFCGQQGSPLGRPPGQREFVSSGRSLRLTFRTQPSSENKTAHLHKGFLALYQAVAVNCSQPVSQASRSSEAINTPGDNPAKVPNHCQEPYYQATAAASTLSYFFASPHFASQGHSAAPPRGPGRTHRMGRRFFSVRLSVDGQSPPLTRIRQPSVLPKLSWATSPGKHSPVSMAVGAGPCWATDGSSLLPTPSTPRTVFLPGRTRV